MVALSPTAVVRHRAAALRRQGVDVYDLSAGELDFPTSGHIIEAAAEAASRPENHHYGPTAGIEPLRQAVATRLNDRSAVPVDAGSVLITHGAKQALFNTFAALLRPGDEVLVPAPYWVTFPSSVRLAGAEPVIVQPDTTTLKITPKHLDAAATTRAKALLICSPSNPTGLAYDAAELAAILSWAADHDMWVVADETYIDLGLHPLPEPTAVEPRIADRLVRIGSVSKSFAMTGWRVGWLTGPAQIVQAATAVQSHTTSNVSGVTQAAALAALTGPDVTADFREILRDRLALCEAILQPLGLFDLPPHGAFYVFADVSRFGTDDAQVADRLLDAGVVTLPGTSFGMPGRLRLSFAIADEELNDGLWAIATSLSGWS